MACSTTPAAQAKGLGLVKADDANIENYVTEKALDGLFEMIGKQEQNIRQNPAAAATSLAKKVFGTPGTRWCHASGPGTRAAAASASFRLYRLPALADARCRMKGLSTRSFRYALHPTFPDLHRLRKPRPDYTGRFGGLRIAPSEKLRSRRRQRQFVPCARADHRAARRTGAAPDLQFHDRWGNAWRRPCWSGEPALPGHQR